MGREWKSEDRRDFNFLSCCLVGRDKNSFVWLTKKSERIGNVGKFALIFLFHYI